MKKNINEEILKKIEFYKGKEVKLNQLGFIESQIIFENLKYSNENDILKLYDEKIVYILR